MKFKFRFPSIKSYWLAATLICSHPACGCSPLAAAETELPAKPWILTVYPCAEKASRLLLQCRENYLNGSNYFCEGNTTLPSKTETVEQLMN